MPFFSLPEVAMVVSPTLSDRELVEDIPLLLTISPARPSDVDSAMDFPLDP